MIPEVKKGDTVQWTNSRKPLGKVVHFFEHKNRRYAVVEDAANNLSVRCVNQNLVVVKA